MAGKILEELKQTKPFHYTEEEVFLNIHRTANVLMQQVLAVLKPYGLSSTQYNVLRILRGAGASGLHCKEIGARMVTPDPDITRLLDRLEKRKLLGRRRAREDRRFVTARITAEGLDILGELDASIQQLLVEMFRHLEPRQLGEIIGLMENVRNGTAA